MSLNPILSVAALLLMFGWKSAGYYGLDRFVVPLLGATWKNDDQKQKRSGPLPKGPQSQQGGQPSHRHNLG
jgi:thiosulfate dehydrogenase [quinone] large subunit